jgi:hypothetical protein
MLFANKLECLFLEEFFSPVGQAPTLTVVASGIPLWKDLVELTNTRQSEKLFSGTNTLAYFYKAKATKKNSFNPGTRC